jgi:hypothetical protein
MFFNSSGSITAYLTHSSAQTPFGGGPMLAKKVTLKVEDKKHLDSNSSSTSPIVSLKT